MPMINSYTYPLSHQMQVQRSNVLNNSKGVLQIFANGCLQICSNSMTKKNKFIMFGTNHQLKKMQSTSTSIAVGNTNLSAVNHVQNLGFLMDNTLKNQSHINKLTSTYL